MKHNGLEGDSGMGSGSGRVAVVPLDRGDQCGSNGGSYNLVVAVLGEIRWSNDK
jgi:hypothetical protein